MTAKRLAVATLASLSLATAGCPSSNDYGQMGL
jgi:hypothetical protein